MRGLALAAPPPTFVQRKKRILEQLAVPDTEYTDASPKGSVDAGIRDLIDEVNSLDGFVTTSSCAGRISVFLEGTKKQAGAAGPGGDDQDRVDGAEGGAEGGGVEDAEVRKLAGVGGKGGGGAWLFVSHDPIALGGDDDDDLMVYLGLKGSPEKENDGERISKEDIATDVTTTRFIHFKFEPMILHVLTASPDHAQLLLRCSLQAGFRESGAVSLTAAAGEQHATPVVGIRSMGLAFESLIGHCQPGDDTPRCTVSSDYLRTLVRIANDRFSENSKRIDRFRTAFLEATGPSAARTGDTGAAWEDAQTRKERKRAEGLKRRAELGSQQQDEGAVTFTSTERGTGTEDTHLDMPMNTDFT